MFQASLACLIAVLLPGAAWAQGKSLAEWRAEFQTLQAGMQRVAAEKEIAALRHRRSDYDVWAMDTSELVVYRLDDETALLVTYRPGIPAAHVTAGAGHPPVDGVLLKFEIRELR